MSRPASDRPEARAEREAFYEQLAPYHLAPLWEVLHSLVTPEPVTEAVPACWRYAETYPLLVRAGEVISAEEAERRVLILENPAFRGQSRITRTLYAGMQLILPGEIAPCHRHTQAALRFVMEGKGAFTAVGGEKAYMNAWDLILTPNWQWHDHGNDSDGPMIWLDGLDIPLVTGLDASFAQVFADKATHPETRPPGDTLARYGANLRPSHRATASPESTTPLFIYPYSDWRQALETMRWHESLDCWDGLKMEFNNPADGGSVLPTISAFCQLLPQGFETKPLRSTDGAVYCVVEGHGTVYIAGEAFDVGEGDVFVVPAWHARRFEAATDFVLFSYSDRATQQKLGLWREELTQA